MTDKKDDRIKFWAKIIYISEIIAVAVTAIIIFIIYTLLGYKEFLILGLIIILLNCVLICSGFCLLLNKTDTENLNNKKVSPDEFPLLYSMKRCTHCGFVQKKENVYCVKCKLFFEE